jgi:hypothetical protein
VREAVLAPSHVARARSRNSARSSDSARSRNSARIHNSARSRQYSRQPLPANRHITGKLEWQGDPTASFAFEREAVSSHLRTRHVREAAIVRESAIVREAAIVRESAIVPEAAIFDSNSRQPQYSRQPLPVNATRQRLSHSSEKPSPRTFARGTCEKQQ